MLMGRFRLLALPLALACLLPSLALAAGEPPRSPMRPGIPAATLAGNELLAKDSGHDSQVAGLAFSPDGKTLVSAGNYGPTVLWDMASRQRRATLQGSFRVFAFSPDGKRLATAAVNSGKARIWDVATAKEVMALTIADALEIPSLLFSPEGGTLLTLDWSSKQQNRFRVRRWDLATGSQLGVWRIPNEIYPMSIAPDGKKVFATLRDGSVGRYDPESGREQTLGRHKAWGWLKLSPDARMLASWKNTPNSPVELWELTTGKQVFELTGHEWAVSVVAWSPEGGLVASGDERGKQDPTGTASVRLWNAATGRAQAHYAGLKADVTALAFAPDATSLVAGMRDGTISILEVERSFAPTPKLGQDELESYWTDLAGADAGKAHHALGELVAGAKTSVPFIKARLKPAREPDPGKIEQWVADLSSDKFTVRQTAAKELEKGDVHVVVLLQEALKTNMSLEASIRLKKIVHNISEGPGPDTLRTVRAIMTLERIGSTQAQGILETLARGAPRARETEEAKASLERLGQRVSKVP